jgi:hypothetical protein
MQRYGKNQYAPNILMICLRTQALFLTFIKETPQSLICIKMKEKTAKKGLSVTYLKYFAYLCIVY